MAEGAAWMHFEHQTAGRRPAYARSSDLLCPGLEALWRRMGSRKSGFLARLAQSVAQLLLYKNLSHEINILRVYSAVS
jgi:hypothetical protein